METQKNVCNGGKKIYNLKFSELDSESSNYQKKLIKMLTENDVVNYLTNFLKKEGYKIIQSLTTTQIGVDIIAEKNNKILYIEAKGQTSSKENSSRYGKPFNLNQIKSHISGALLASMRIISTDIENKDVIAGIALPDTPNQQKIIKQILPALKELNKYKNVLMN